MLLTNNLADIGNIFLGGHEIDEITYTQLVEATRYNGVFTTLNCYNVVGIVGAT